jgi:hypothetical protein
LGLKDGSNHRLRAGGDRQIEIWCGFASGLATTRSQQYSNEQQYSQCSLSHSSPHMMGFTMATKY